MTDDCVALIDELQQLAARYRGQVSDMSALAPVHVRNAPCVAIHQLLYDDALGIRPLPDHVTTRIWELAWAVGCDADDVMPRDILEQAREGRRTRPPEPVRYPLKGGGHAAGRGLPGKTEFPDRWSDDDAMTLVMDVVRSPAGAVKQPDGTFRARGVRDGVDLRVIVTELGHVVTAYPVAGDGVVTNPLDAVRTPYVQRLRHVVESTELDDEAREGMDELMAAGEWDQVVQQLRVLPVPADLADELASLAESTGLG